MLRRGKGVGGWGSEMEAGMGQVLGGECWRVWLVTWVHRHLSAQLDVRLKPKPEWRCQAASLSQLPRAASMVLGGQKMLGLKPSLEAEFPKGYTSWGGGRREPGEKTHSSKGTQGAVLLALAQVWGLEAAITGPTGRAGLN